MKNATQQTKSQNTPAAGFRMQYAQLSVARKRGGIVSWSVPAKNKLVAYHWRTSTHIRLQILRMKNHATGTVTIMIMVRAIKTARASLVRINS